MEDKRRSHERIRPRIGMIKESEQRARHLWGSLKGKREAKNRRKEER